MAFLRYPLINQYLSGYPHDERKFDPGEWQGQIS